MNPETYQDNPIETIARQVEDYEKAGLDPNMQVTRPLSVEDDKESIIAKGASWAGIIRILNQTFTRNVGNSLGALVRKAIENKTDLPGQAEVDAIVARYDFSGVRTSAEEHMSEEDKMLRSVLRDFLKKQLRGGVYSEDWDPETGTGTPINVQTAKEAKANKLPEGKMALDDFNDFVEGAANQETVVVGEVKFDFSGDPKYRLNDEGDIEGFDNLAAVVGYCTELAQTKLELKRKATINATMMG